MRNATLLDNRLAAAIKYTWRVILTYHVSYWQATSRTTMGKRISVTDETLEGALDKLATAMLEVDGKQLEKERNHDD